MIILLLIMVTLKIGLDNNKDKQEETIETISSENIIIIEKVAEISSKTTDCDLILVNKPNKIPDNYHFELDEIENGNKVDSRMKSAITQMLEKKDYNPIFVPVITNIVQ